MKKDWNKVQEWVNENKDLLIVIADPRSDSVNISFGGLNAFVRFPMESIDKGVIFNALRASKFNEAIDPLIFGIMDATKMAVKEGSPLLIEVGSAIKSIGVARENIKNGIIKEKTNGKSKKNR